MPQWRSLLIFSCLAGFGRTGLGQSTLPAGLLPVPIIRQATDYSCGAAAFMALLVYWKTYDGGELALHSLLKLSKKNGVSPMAMAKAASKFGLDGQWRENLNRADLEMAWHEGQPVILDLQAWPDDKDKGKPWSEQWEAGHYVILLGFDGDLVYLMDPSVAESYTFMPYAELEERWHDYETVNGKIWRNQHLGIFIRGKNTLGTFPAQPSKTN